MYPYLSELKSDKSYQIMQQIDHFWLYLGHLKSKSSRNFIMAIYLADKPPSYQLSEEIRVFIYCLTRKKVC